MPSTLTRRPQATAFSIEDLMDRVRRGEVRIPQFQRPLQWTAEDARELFDSVYRGYPIGTLLFWKREAPAASISFGPVRIDAPFASQALWVVDGQQRITALTGVLLHPADEARDDFALYFDLELEEVISSENNAQLPQHWLPLRVVLDSELLLEWLDRYPGRAQNPEHTRRAIRLGKSIREYQVPAYVVEDAEEKTLRIIFKRLNTAGKPLTQTEVFNALYGGTAGSRPATLKGLAEELKTLGFGTLPESTVLRAVLAIRGFDFTQDFKDQLREEEDLTETLQDTQRALQNAIVFLKRDAGIPHILLLPEQTSIYLLSLFFHLHPEPSSRSRELLSRWLWRRAAASSINILLPADTAAPLTDSEEQSVQELLAQVPSSPPAWEHQLPSLRFFNLDTSIGVVEANALVSLHPRHLLTGALLDVTAMLEESGHAAFHPIIPNKLTLEPEQTEPMLLLQSITANYIFHPPLPDTDVAGALKAAHRLGLETFTSHALTEEEVRLVQEDQHGDFLFKRMTALTELTVGFLKARTRWDESDRPSLQSLIVDDEED